MPRPPRKALPNQRRMSSGGVHSVPPEILSDIFLHFNHVIRHGLDSVQATLRLTHICQRWRMVALSTPRLWSQLQLVISEKNAHSESSLLSTWITRSSVSPLTISLSWRRPPFIPHHPALEILAQCSDRWQDIHLHLPALAYRNGALDAARANMPQLTHLSLEIADGPWRLDSSWDLFSVAPKLISFQSVDCHTVSLRIPWGQLAHVPALSMAMRQSIQFLQRSPNLCKVTFYYDDHLDSPPYPVVLHKNLTSVSLRPGSPSEIDYNGFFSNVTVPNLRSLKIDAFVDSMPASLITFLSKITMLNDLSIHGYIIDSSILLRSLEVTQSLTHLDIYGAEIAGQDTFLARLKSRTGGDGGWRDFALVPKLGVLAILISRPNLESFIELVESRAGTLQKVRLQLHVDQPPDPRLRNRLEEIQSTTLSINITTTDYSE